MMRRVALLVVVAVIGFVSFSASLALAQMLTRAETGSSVPLARGSDQFFPATWAPIEKNGRRYVNGYVANVSGIPARRVQILVDGLDLSGRVMSQTVSWVGEISPGSRTYFEVRAPQPGATYRVSVLFDLLQ